MLPNERELKAPNEPEQNVIQMRLKYDEYSESRNLRRNFTNQKRK